MLVPPIGVIQVFYDFYSKHSLGEKHLSGLFSNAMPNIFANNLGYPRIGEHRELKKATEAYWRGDLSLQELEDVGRRIREANWRKQQEAGLDWIPCGDFSFYDHVLDTTCMVGNVPPRFGWSGGEVGLDLRFLIARGQRDQAGVDGDEKDCQLQKVSTFASEMTKWFDTNYHYIVPEFSSETTFRMASYQVINHFIEARALGYKAKPVLLGPVTYLAIGKVHDKTHPDFDPFALLDGLLAVYAEVLRGLQKFGAEWVQIDEPILCLDLDSKRHQSLQHSFEKLRQAAPGLKLMVATYFGELRDNLALACQLPVHGLHFDAVRGAGEVEQIAQKLPTDCVLSLGLVDGRNVWINPLARSLETIRKVLEIRPDSELWLAPSCSLLHAPITLKNEPQLDAELKSWLAFADEKLAEVVALRELALGRGGKDLLERNQAAVASRQSSPRIHDQRVQERLRQIEPKMLRRNAPFPERKRLQRAKLNLPAFPTTTIGSFPQTGEVRAARAKWRKGEISDAEYEAFLREEIKRCIEFQEEIGIDMPVHGEFERNDMVEYFGEQLEGFAFTANGWVQSYGSRYVKPPVIFGDVSRSRPMTTYWSEYAQSLTSRPVKGMLTGPVTILQWSFVRDDQPREVTARQIALAIRDEVADLEKSGIAAIQIDEPAFREGLPLRQSDWPAYLKWAVEAFRLCSCGVRDDTQIHTHMCYSEFNDIIESIAALDADVITIETSRSNMELLEAFVDFKYPAEIGPGVYDIHSPRVPAISEMQNLMSKALDVLPAENLWINPDCGLKTRRWEEVKPSLANMVQVAKNLRASVAAITASE